MPGSSTPRSQLVQRFPTTDASSAALLTDEWHVQALTSIARGNQQLQLQLKPVKEHNDVDAAV